MRLSTFKFICSAARWSITGLGCIFGHWSGGASAGFRSKSRYDGNSSPVMRTERGLRGSQGTGDRTQSAGCHGERQQLQLSENRGEFGRVGWELATPAAGPFLHHNRSSEGRIRPVKHILCLLRSKSRHHLPRRRGPARLSLRTPGARRAWLLKTHTYDDHTGCVARGEGGPPDACWLGQAPARLKTALGFWALGLSSWLSKSYRAFVALCRAAGGASGSVAAAAAAHLPAPPCTSLQNEFPQNRG